MKTWRSTVGFILAAAALTPSLGRALPNFALRYTAPGDCAAAADAADLDPASAFTVEAWIRPEAANLGPTFAFILSKNLGYSGWALLEVNSAGFHPGFQVFNDDLNVTQEVYGTTSPATGVWSHVAGVYGSGEVKIYVDGTLQGTAVAAGPATENAVDLYIGCSLFGSATYWKGDIDRVRIWSRALTAAEIDAGRFHEPSVPDPDLVAKWDFDEGTGSTSADSSGRGHVVTLGASGTTQPQWALVSPGDFAPLVAGVSEVGTPYQVSSLVAAQDAWVGIVGGDEDSSLSSTTVAARELNSGRVVALQANGLGISLATLDNLALFNNISNWLRGSGAKTLGYLVGHGEGVEAEWIDAWQKDGFTVSGISAPLSSSSFSGLSVVVASGNLASDTPYTVAELNAILGFVSQGGGLLQVGLGWPNAAYGAGRRLADELGIWFVADAVSDPTDNFGSELQPKFHVLHPAAPMPGIPLARGTLAGSHAANQGDWNLAMEDPGPRRSYLRALRGLDLLGVSAPTDSGIRDATRGLFLDLFDEELNPWAGPALGRSLRYDPVVDSMAAFVREYLLKVWFNTVRPEAFADLGLFGELSPNQSELIGQVPIVVLDNAGLDSSQSQFVADLLTAVPNTLHRVRALSFLELIRDPATSWPGLPPELNQWEFYAQRSGDVAVNSFSTLIGEVPGNPFSPDVPPFTSDLFTSALVHELNHGVDSASAYGIPSRAARRAALLARAGCDHLNFLRSVLPDCWFQDNQGEFIASMSNIFGVFTERTLDVALLRMNAGRYEPMNQFLFMLELYSAGGSYSYFWKVTSTAPPAAIERSSIYLTRNEGGFIRSFDWKRNRYTFTLDSEGWVTGIEIAPAPPVFSDGFESGSYSNWS